MSATPDAAHTSAARVLRGEKPGDAPRQLDGWELVELVHDGAMSQVYLARAAQSGSQADAPRYALKLLQPAWHNDSQAVAMFRREAQLGRQLAYPHLIGVLAGRIHEPPYYLVTPWLEGATLADWPAPLVTPHVLWIARQVVETLGYLHQHGWLHGDIKPANIHVSPEGHVTLLDLGFARRLDEVTTVFDRPLFGTIEYLAPERLSSSLASDLRSDFYSLGVLLYELLGGRKPFEAADLAELASQHLQTVPPPLRSLAPTLSAELARLVHALLAKHPMRRPQSTEELLDLLLRAEMDALVECAAA